MRNTIHAVVAIAVLAFCGLGCSTEPRSEASKESLQEDVTLVLKQMEKTDPALTEFLDKSYGYAIFPSVGKGGLIVGGAYGRGAVYEEGNLIGYADLTQGNVGLQAGGQTYRELVAFENKDALERFKTGKLKFSADASAVALKAGAAASADYEDGVAVFTEPTGGLMVEASIGGQQFTFIPLQD